MKKKISLLGLVLILTLSLFTGCSKSETTEYDQAELEQYADFIIQNFSAMSGEQMESFQDMSELELDLTLLNTGVPVTGESFLDLLKALNAVEGIERYRISSIEPNLLTDEIIEFCASSRKFQHHFHIPIQSGSDRILAAMRRRYTSARFADRVNKVRAMMPDAFIGIDVITGFPGEAEEDFMQTYTLMERLAPSFLHIFPFSERPGTPAVDMPGKVPAAVSTERAARLEALCERLHHDFCARYVGTQADVLFESTVRGGMMSGYTGNYIRVKVPYRRDLINRISRVRLLEVDPAGEATAKILE